ncbi:MAG: peptidase S13 [Sphingobacteriaceae bacterium]|nr:MAG: peptidase S13 [Sphingobacteriaceae bacterium]
MLIKISKLKSKLAYCFYALIFASITSCSHQITQHKISKLFNNSVINQNHFTGFALYDQDKKKMIFAENETKYFTPASNTKLFTFYTSLQILGDSIPGLRYTERNDSLIFWGTGDPSFLHSALKSTNHSYNGDFYGEGWPYGDYNDYYQAEINALPIEDNVAKFSVDVSGNLQVKPAYFQSKLVMDSTFQPKNYTIKRALFENKFMYPAGTIPSKFKQEIPWKTSSDLTINLLQDTLKKPVELVNINLPENAKTLYSIPADSVYKYMLLPSDNFIAEQLLLVCSSKLGGNLSTRATINFSKKNFLKDLPDEPQWADGSGLSRQNLFTPRTMIALLQKIQIKVNNDQKLHGLLATGGVSGTLKNAYKTDSGVPFVWGKTGSLGNVYNQSGYLLTRKGKKLLFCYMNNNFTQPTAVIRSEMARIITEIHNRF